MGLLRFIPWVKSDGGLCHIVFCFCFVFVLFSSQYPLLGLSPPSPSELNCIYAYFLRLGYWVLLVFAFASLWTSVADGNNVAD